MTEVKHLICSLGCRDGKAVCQADGGAEESADIRELCRHCGDSGADQLLIYDCSQTDEDHERTIGCIKEIAREVDTPIITGGRVKRLEDVKKYLYAGAEAVFLEAGSEENVDLIQEASSRFGTEKIYMNLTEAAQLKRAAEFAQLGASKMILSFPFDSELLSEISRMELPLLLSGADESRAAESFRIPNVEGLLLPAGWDGNWMACKQALKEQGFAVETFESTLDWNQFRLNSDGLIPVIVQDYKTSEVLMMAYMNQEAFRKTLETGTMTYFSRSRQSLWLKGETSGHFQYVKSLSIDCDQDTILAKVHQIGAACHTGNRSCFFTTLAEKEYKETNPLKVFEEVYDIIKDRKKHPKEGSYTNYLFDKGIDKILKKCGEEATEIIIAAKNPDPEEIKYEISDFLYHVMVLMVEKGVTWEEITRELANR
ncbi:MAG: bifunctional phosphoribosyl-AMP cyclohydrolase/phosphoribosyl-ATP diphosphatase HisIE [Lachnospiraceae bacterium]|nr:bifunctional phosphoribosyl-AMP cyclohydrolase/phosphoribosyl-ATP diphosphatase HisIE [Lachnospiraceae bacterium]